MNSSASDDMPPPLPRKPTDTMIGGDAVPTEGEGPFETDLLVEGDPEIVTEGPDDGGSDFL